MANNRGGAGKKKPGAGWHGDVAGHKVAGQKAAQTAEERYGEDFHQDIGSKGGRAAQQSGQAHKLTDEERSKGGRIAHQRGTAHEFTSEEARIAGSRGGSRSRS